MSLLDRLKRQFKPASDLRRRLELEPEAQVAAAATLTDAAGQPVDKTVLSKEHAAPTMGGVRSVLYNAAIGALDPFKLQRILNAAVQGQAEEYLTLAEEMEEKYFQYRAALRTRKLAVVGLDITVEAASDKPMHQKHADLVRQFLNRDTVDAESVDVLDALGKGYSVTEMVWATKKSPWLPVLKTRDPRWFEFDPIDMDRLLLKGGPDNSTALATPLKPYKYIVHRSSDKSGVTIRAGLARVVAWAYLFANMSLKDWVIAAEVYGMPIRIGKYGPGAGDDDRRALLRAVTNIATDAAAIIPDGMVVEFVNAMAGGGPEIYKELCGYLDQSTSKVVLGQTATTDATAGGLGGSQGTVHNEVREDIRDADAKALAATYNRDLVRPLIDLNFGPPKDELYPRIRIGRAKQYTAEENEQVYAFVDRGGKVAMSVMRDRLGLEDPAEEEELIQPKSAAKAPAPEPTDKPEDAPSEKPPEPPEEEAEATEVAATARRAFSGLLKPSQFNFVPAARVAEITPPDAIDRLVEAAATEWLDVMPAMMDPIYELAAASTGYDDFVARLAKLQTKLDTAGMTDLLARSMFMARLTGEAGIDIHGGGDGGA